MIPGDTHKLELLAVSGDGRIFKLGVIDVRLRPDLTPAEIAVLAPIARDAIERHIGTDKKSRRVPVKAAQKETALESRPTGEEP